MSITQGSFSITRYKILGRNAPISYASVAKSFKQRKLADFRLSNSQKEMIYGWDFPRFVASEIPTSWDLHDCRSDDDGLWLRVRVEKRKVSKNLLQLVSQERLAAFESENKDKKISRQARKQLLEEVKDELLARSLPTLSFFDAYWDENKDEILLFTSSKNNCSLFEELFLESFAKPLELQLIKITPPLLGLSRQEWSGTSQDSTRVENLEKALPSSLYDAEA